MRRAARSRHSTSSTCATTASASAGTRPRPVPSFPRRSSPRHAPATSRPSSASPASRSRTTSPTPRSSFDESDCSRPAEGRDPRPPGRGGREFAAPARVPGGRGARRARDRPRRRCGHHRRGTGRDRAHVRAPAREPADRKLRDRGRRLSEVAPRIAVLVFPGSNDDRDAAWALTALGADPRLVWHAEEELHEVDAVVLPGGFSYGDYLRCGAIARFSPAMQAVTAFAAEGGLVLGICNGFQILCEAGLLPGVLRPNASLSFICRDVSLRVERNDTALTSRCEPGQSLVVPIKHHDGAWFAPPELVEELEAKGQILLRYEDNPNGATADVAGVMNESGNVLGLMPHPEHAVDPLLGS